MKGVATFYFLNDNLVVEGIERTVDGMHVISGWVEALPLNADDTQLGKTAHAALAQYQTDAPSVDREEITRRLGQNVAKAGTRSYAAFLKGTRSVDLQADDKGITLTPMKNGGPSGREKGFTFLEDRALIKPIDLTDEQLGAAIREAWALAE